MQTKTEGILQKLFRNAKQGGRKFVSLYRAHGLVEAIRLIWNNVLLVETVCRMEKDLSVPDIQVESRIPLNIEVLDKGFDLQNWHGRKEILKIRDKYGLDQFQMRLERGDLCFAAYSNGEFSGFIWLEFPPGVEAGYSLNMHEAYTYDGWTFENFRGKRVFPVIQQTIMDYVRDHHKEIRSLVTHVATWNKSSLSGDQLAGYVIQYLERTIMILGVHRKQRLNRVVPSDLIMHQK